MANTAAIINNTAIFFMLLGIMFVNPVSIPSKDNYSINIMNMFWNLIGSSICFIFLKYKLKNKGDAKTIKWKFFYYVAYYI